MGRDRSVRPNGLNLGQIEFRLLHMATILKLIMKTYLAAS